MARWVRGKKRKQRCCWRRSRRGPRASVRAAPPAGRAGRRRGRQREGGGWVGGGEAAPRKGGERKQGDARALCPTRRRARQLQGRGQGEGGSSPARAGSPLRRPRRGRPLRRGGFFREDATRKGRSPDFRAGMPRNQCRAAGARAGGRQQQQRRPSAPRGTRPSAMFVCASSLPMCVF